MNDRIKFTEAEKRVMMEHPTSDRIMFMGSNDDIDTLVRKEKARKFNNELEANMEKMEKQNKEIEKTQDSLGYDLNKAEIKPMFARILVKPFAHNPFQKMTVENGLIIDAGGYTPHTQMNPLTGKNEEQDEFIRTGVVVETGPECKYLQEGDVVYFRKDTMVPVPFFKQGLISLNENQVICAVNEGLTDRFNKTEETTWVDVSKIPESFGDTVEARLEKWAAYKKLGICVVDNGK